jgi:hypothetical protein
MLRTVSSTMRRAVVCEDSAAARVISDHPFHAAVLTAFDDVTGDCMWEDRAAASAVSNHPFNAAVIILTAFDVTGDCMWEDRAAQVLFRSSFPCSSILTGFDVTGDFMWEDSATTCAVSNHRVIATVLTHFDVKMMWWRGSADAVGNYRSFQIFENQCNNQYLQSLIRCEKIMPHIINHLQSSDQFKRTYKLWCCDYEVIKSKCQSVVLHVPCLTITKINSSFIKCTYALRCGGCGCEETMSWRWRLELFCVLTPFDVEVAVHVQGL